MDQREFERIAHEGTYKLTALMTAARTSLVAYNAYIDETEVVVLGHRREDDGSILTRPIAILVTEDLFDRLKVDDEAGRVDGAGNDTTARKR